MKDIYFTTGPTMLYPQGEKFITKGLNKGYFSISHRSKEFENIFRFTVKELKTLLKIPEKYLIFFFSSGTECMERIIQNLVEEKSFHFINGAFSRRFFDISKDLKKKTKSVIIKDGNGYNPLEYEIPADSELICLTHNETSTGVALEAKNIYELKMKHKDALIALDIVTSVPYYKIDYKKIDVSFFSVQKGFGIPAGLGVMIINPFCIKKTKILKEKGINIGSYNNFINWENFYYKNQTTVTPNVFAIYLSGRIANLLNKKGILKIRKDTEKKSELIYNYFDRHKSIKPFVSDNKYRSKTTIVLDAGTQVKKIRDILKRNGYIVSPGYGNYKNIHLRIGNFPMHKISDVRKIIKLITKIDG